MKQLAWRRALTFIALTSILVQSLSPLVTLSTQKAFAQEITQETTVTPTETPTATPTPVPSVTTPAPTPIITPSETPIVIPSPTPELTTTPEATSTDNLSPPSKEVQPSATLNSPQWQKNPDGSQTTTNVVSLNQVYKAPQNSSVTVTFTKLPDNPGKLTITEVKLTAGQQKASGALSDTAYNISSDMTDGTFQYNLTLPVPDTAQGKNLGIKSSETVDGLKTSGINQANQTTGNVATIIGLNHFTIFVIVNLQPTYAAPGGSGVYSAYYGPPDYNAVSPGETAVYDGLEAGIIKAGINIDTDGHYWDEGLFGFSPTITINQFASNPVTYKVENQAGVNPVWMTIEIDTGTVGDRSDNTVYQFVPTSYGTANGYHVIDATAGQWHQWTTYTSGVLTGSPVTLSQIAAANSGLNVVRVYLRLGMGDSYNNGGTGTIAWVNNVVFGGDTYNFNTQPACNGSTFDSFKLGSVNGQGGWTITGPYEQAVVNNSYNYSSFGCKTLRVSDSITSGSFGDQLFAPPVINGAGESSATAGAFSIGTRQNHFETQFDIASTMLNQQTGLHLSVSPDRGDGSRMSYLRFEDNTNGIDVFFDDVQGTSNPANFVETKIDTLNRTAPHTVKFSMDFLGGPSNDIVKIYIDGNLVHTGTSWENYYRYDKEASAEQSPRIVKTVLFRQSGTAVPTDKGNGFLIDNFSDSSTTVNPTPTTNPATNISLTGSTLNAINGDLDANNTSFWWGTTSIASLNSCINCNSQLPNGWNHDTGLGGKLAGASFNENLTGLTPGTKYYFVAWSFVGGIWFPGQVQTFTTISPDTTPPDVPTLLSPINGIYRQTSNSNYSDWSTVTDPSYPVVYYYESSPSTNTKPDGSFTTTYYKSSALSDSQIMNPGEPEVTYYWHVKACDAVGNCSNWSPAWQINIDNTPPSIPVLTYPINGLYINNNKPLMQWDDSTDNRGVAGYDYQVYYNCANSLSIPSSCSNIYKTSTISSQYQAGKTNDGTYYWQVRAKDKAGNTSSWSDLEKVTIDTISPTADLIFSAIGPTATGFQVAFSEDVNSSDASNPTNYFLNNWPGAGGSGNLVGHATITYSPTTHIATVTFTTPGWYISPEQQWGVENIHDLAGNVQSTNPYTEYSTPMVPPTTPVANPGAGDYNSSQSVTLTSTDSGSGLKNIYYTIDGTTPDNTKTLYTSPINVDHDMTIMAIAYDQAGNSSSVLSASYGIPPVISNQSIVRTNDNSVLVTWTTNFPATSRVVYDTVSHSTLGSAPNYGYAYSTTEDTNKVTSHSVTITGLTVNQDYYYRTVSAGSPEAVGNETAFATYYVFGLAGDGKSDGKSDGLSSCPGCTQTPQLVLGASTSQQQSSEQLLASNDKGTQGDVLGASTESAKVQTEKTTPEKVASSSSNLLLWSILFLVILLILFFIYKKIIKKSASN